MIKKVFLIVNLFLVCSCCFGTEKLPIFPYKVDGYKGFMNTNFEIITEPEFNCEYLDSVDADYSKYAARSTKIINENKYWYIVLYNFDFIIDAKIGQEHKCVDLMEKK